MLEEKFTEDELRQVISVMENPAWIKFQQMGPDMQKPLMEKLIADSRAQIEPKIKALEQSIAKRLGIQEGAGAGASSAHWPRAARSTRPARSRAANRRRPSKLPVARPVCPRAQRSGGHAAQRHALFSFGWMEPAKDAHRVVGLIHRSI